MHAPLLGARALCFDDAEYVTDNPLVSHPSAASVTRFFSEIRRPSGFKAYYHPLTLTVLMLGEAAGGRAERPTAFHAIGLALHGLCTVLVMAIVFRLFGDVLVAAVAAALFGIHPLTVEPIAWIAELKTLLAAAFALGSLLAWLGAPRRGRRAVSWLLYLGALLSKPAALPLPLIFVAVDVGLRRRPLGAALRDVWPFAMPAIASGVVTLVSQRNVGGITPGSAGDLTEWPWRTVSAVGLALEHLFVPLGLTPAYPVPPHFDVGASGVAFHLAVVVAAILLAAFAWRWTRAPATALAILLIGIAPTLAPIRYTWALTFDQYLYLPMLGFVLLAAAGLRALRTRVPHPAILLLLVLPVLAGEAVAARAAMKPWKDTFDLIAHMSRLSPDSPVVENTAGIALGRGGRSKESIRHLRRAVELAPGYGAAQFNLGVALAASGDLRGSVAAFRAAADLLPDDADAASNLAEVLLLTGEPGPAIAAFRRALVLRPADARAEYRLASAFAADHAAPESTDVHLERAIAIAPKWAPPLNDLAWRSASDPGSPRFDPPRAVALARRAVDAAGGEDPRLLDTYSVTLAAAGHFAEAESVEARALRGVDGAGGNPALGTALRTRMALYSRGLPYVESSRPAAGR